MPRLAAMNYLETAPSGKMVFSRIGTVERRNGNTFSAYQQGIEDPAQWDDRCSPHLPSLCRFQVRSSGRVGKSPSPGAVHRVDFLSNRGYTRYIKMDAAYKSELA